MATTVIYNGVIIHNCTTREMDQELVYDASGSDLVAIRYKLGFEGWIHAQANASETGHHGVQAADVPFANGLALVQFDRVSGLLSETKRAFSLKWSGTPVLTATAAIPGQTILPTTDVENGPKPRGLAVLNVTPAAIKVRWGVEVVLSGCPAPLGAGTAIRRGPYRIINNRWSISESLDADFFTTRRIAGTIRFAEGLTAKHAFVAAVIPGLEKGFKREGFEYDVAPSGLEAVYSIVDRQTHYSAPAPATAMDVTHSYSTNDGLTWLDNCDVTLRGSPEADRRQLLQRMLQIIDARCEGLRVVNSEDKQYLIENVVITEKFGVENIVSAVFTVKHMGEGTRMILGNILQNKLGKPLELPALSGTGDNAVGLYDRTVSRRPADHGYDPHGDVRSPAFLYLLTCYYQDPCGQVKHIYGGSQASNQEEQKEEKQPPAYPVRSPGLTLPPGGDGNYSQAHKASMYTFASLSSRYVVDRLRVLLPMGKANAGGETAELADLAPGVAKRILYYDAERVGDWPQIPALLDTYQDGDVKGALLSAFVEPEPPGLSPDGIKRIFRVRVKACYGLNKAPAEKMAVGVLPYTSFKPADGAFPLASAQSTTIGP